MARVVRPDMMAILGTQPNSGSIHCPLGHCAAMSRERFRERFSQSRPFLGCFIGTLSPSRFHKRPTHLLFTCCRQAVFTPPRGASLRLVTRQPPGGSHSGRTAASSRSCLRSHHRKGGVLRQHAPVALDVAWTDAGPEPGNTLTADCCAIACRAAGRREGLRGSARSGLPQDQFVQGQVRNRTPKALVLFLEAL